MRDGLITPTNVRVDRLRIFGQVALELFPLTYVVIVTTLTHKHPSVCCSQPTKPVFAGCTTHRSVGNG